MLTQDVRVHFQGFHPAEKTEQRLDRWAHDLHEVSPSEANLKAIYSKNGREYQGEMRVTSRAGHFYAIARGPNLYAVARDLMKRMRKQLDRWKTVRFNQHQEVRHQVPTNPNTEYGTY